MAEVRTRHLRGGVWTRYGRTNTNPSDNSFLLGETKPNATNTGVQAGITLAPYNLGGPDTITITQDNQVFENLDVYGYVKIQARGTVFRNCYFHGGTSMPTGDTAIVDCNHDKNFATLIEFCDFNPDVPNYYTNAVLGHEVTVRRCHIRRTNDGIGLYAKPGVPNPVNARVEGCYIHDLVFWYPYPLKADGTHNDCIQIQGGSDITITGNTLVCSNSPDGGTQNNTRAPHGYGQGLMIQQNTYPLARVIIEKNWVDDGNASINIDPTLSKYATVTLTLRGNRLGRNQYDFTPASSSKYAVRIANRAASTIVGLDTNVWEDTGVPLAEGKTLGIRYDA